MSEEKMKFYVKKNCPYYGAIKLMLEKENFTLIYKCKIGVIMLRKDFEILISQKKYNKNHPKMSEMSW